MLVYLYYFWFMIQGNAGAGGGGEQQQHGFPTQGPPPPPPPAASFQNAAAGQGGPNGGGPGGKFATATQPWTFFLRTCYVPSLSVPSVLSVFIDLPLPLRYRYLVCVLVYTILCFFPVFFCSVFCFIFFVCRFIPVCSVWLSYCISPDPGQIGAARFTFSLVRCLSLTQYFGSRFSSGVFWIRIRNTDPDPGSLKNI